LRRRISINKLSQKNSKEIINEMSKARISLLRSLGCWQLSLGTFWVRWACLFFLSMAERRAKKLHLKPQIARKNALGHIFEKGAPAINDPGFPKIDDGFVIGFNHPSLGEVLRLMGICMLDYETRDYLFPVNIIWFEALAPVMKRLNRFGFTLMPVITPSARKTLLKHARNPYTQHQVDRLTSGFGRVYVERAVEFIKNKQIVVVAPSATRKRYVFDSKASWEGKRPVNPRTMTILADALLRNQDLDFYFLPVAVVPPRGGSTGLNLKKAYHISACPALSRSEIQAKFNERETHEDGSKRRFLERYFLGQIATRLDKISAGDMKYAPG